MAQRRAQDLGMDAEDLEIAADAVPFEDVLRDPLQVPGKAGEQPEHGPILREIGPQDHAVHVEDGGERGAYGSLDQMARSCSGSSLGAKGLEMVPAAPRRLSSF